MTDSAPEYIDTMLRNIVGIEVTVTSLVGKSKLSQNREARDRLNAAEVLSERGRAQLAQRMRDPGLDDSTLAPRRCTPPSSLLRNANSILRFMHSIK